MTDSVKFRLGSFREILKQKIRYTYKKRGAVKAWRKRHGLVFKKHPEYNRPLDSAIEKSHKEVWGDFGWHPGPSTLRICSHISGETSPFYLPEEIYQADIEPVLNRYPSADFQMNKSLYSRFHGEGLFPDDILHRMDGEYYDSNLCPVSESEMLRIAETAEFPAVLKPNGDTRGGKGVHFVSDSDQLISLAKREINFVAQKKIEQHPELRKFHPQSLNTVRVDLYKSVKDNSYHLLHAALRMGKHGSLDNLTSGGIVSYINEEGYLHGYALDKYGEKYLKHPDTGIPFTVKIPEFELLKDVSLKVAENLFLLRTFALDLCFDENGNWRVIEINPANSIRFAQYAGRPFYGEFTEEVIEYCRKNHWALS